MSYISATETEESVKLTAVCLPYTGTVGNQTYSNVTEHWVPRVGETGLLLAIVVPTTYAAVALIVTIILRRKKLLTSTR